MSEDALILAGLTGQLQTRLIAALRADPDVKALFGDPARIYEDETRRAAYPYARLTRHETRPQGSTGGLSTLHSLTFTTHSEEGGRQFAARAIHTLQRAAEQAPIALTGGHIVLVYPIYADIFKTRDGRRFRGLLRLGVISEET